MSKNKIIYGHARDYVPKLTRPIHCVLTDPPYGVDVHMNSATTQQSKAINERIENDANPTHAIDVFYQEMAPILPRLADQAEIYVFTSWNVLDWWMPAVKRLSYLHPDGWVDTLSDPLYEIDLKMMLIWDKGYPGKGDLLANWGCGYEPILYLKKGRRPIPRRRVGILHVDKVPSGQNIHPTEKPVPLLKMLLEMSTSPGDLVVDPFSGSGSTSVAAMELGRDSLGFEIDERFIGPSRARLDTQPLFA